MELRVADNPDKARYEIAVDGEVAGFIDYHLSGHTIAFLHAETDPDSRHAGIGGRMVHDTLDSARERGLDVLPYCPFVRSWIGEHPDYTDLVPPGRRAEFGL
jgi:predicted GNAT family acetyltransferase